MNSTGFVLYSVSNSLNGPRHPNQMASDFYADYGKSSYRLPTDTSSSASQDTSRVSTDRVACSVSLSLARSKG